MTARLANRCGVKGEARQQERTSNMTFSVAELVPDRSRFCTLLPGDLIFTGTPAGIGGVHGIYLAEGDVIASSVEGIGSLENRCVAGA
ncbi:MAG: fumarylacetoacetate hydrolase family protein [Myxococcota bacterium]